MGKSVNYISRYIWNETKKRKRTN